MSEKQPDKRGKKGDKRHHGKPHRTPSIKDEGTADAASHKPPRHHKDRASTSSAELADESTSTTTTTTTTTTDTTGTTDAKGEIAPQAPLSPRSLFLNSVVFVDEFDTDDHATIDAKHEEPPGGAPADAIDTDHHANNSTSEPEAPSFTSQVISGEPTPLGGAARRKTTPILTKFELARVIGTRALQLSQDAPATVDTLGETDAMRIALMEFFAGRIPMTVRRFLPDGSFEDWPLTDLNPAQSSILIPPITKNYQYPV